VIDYDAELQLHNERFRAALAIRAADRVLDIGCGTGETTRQAALVASGDDALGVDIDAGMIARARELTDREGVPNVRFEVGDAQAHPFLSGAFDIAISRFGTMFFSDPETAFRNSARAVRVGGRLVMMVWQAHDRNEWAVAIDQALGVGEVADPDTVPASATSISCMTRHAPRARDARTRTRDR
jgi:ubiquinone/menaquinone biosynthesis C-methylase UbiE